MVTARLIVRLSITCRFHAYSGNPWKITVLCGGACVKRAYHLLDTPSDIVRDKMKTTTDHKF